MSKNRPEEVIKMSESREFKLPRLPYAKNSMLSFLTEETFDYHYGKHHQAYIDKLNSMLKTEKSFGPDVSLEELVQKTQGGLFNQAGQAWNHTFYWMGLSPEKQSPTSGELKKAIDQSFGSMDQFQTKFVEAGVGVFGSGWIWLVKDSSNKLEIVGTSNAENPIRQGKMPLLVSDVWEHAYYIDFRNQRKSYLEKFMAHVNWQFVQENFASAKPANMTQLM
jgi:Fe-Mn family superoxide dismutase